MTQNQGKQLIKYMIYILVALWKKKKVKKIFNSEKLNVIKSLHWWMLGTCFYFGKKTHNVH